uniref:Uncharacterized protein n=1 Tax=Zea mays TaxID=4577 RepID=B4FNP0_MAIZE|nr:unknown [Zea mays]
MKRASMALLSPRDQISGRSLMKRTSHGHLTKTYASHNLLFLGLVRSFSLMPSTCEM